jgi:malonyl-CoA O-methyltransferase
MLNPSDLDLHAIAHRFERLGRATPDGRSIDRIDFYLREVERRMLERLSWTKLVPEKVLDIGCGRGKGMIALQERFPSAMVMGIDLAFHMMVGPTPAIAPTASAKRNFFATLFNGTKPSKLNGIAANKVQGDSGRLPMAQSSFDLLWSNLMFHWLPNAQDSVDEWYRVIRPGGLLSFTAFGVDTFKELRDIGLPLMALPDMHDIGDLLVKSGFSEPVMDQQKLVLTYTDAAKLIKEAMSFGGHVQRNRIKGLQADRKWRKTLETVEGLRAENGKFSLTTEIVFGHTWCPEQKKLPDGWMPLALKPYLKSDQKSSGER